MKLVVGSPLPSSSLFDQCSSSGFLCRIDPLLGLLVVAFEGAHVDGHQCFHAVAEPPSGLAQRNAGPKPTRRASVAGVVDAHGRPASVLAPAFEAATPVGLRGPLVVPRSEQEAVGLDLVILDPAAENVD